MSHKIRRSLLAAALALTGAVAAPGPAHASDGTSNTIMFAEAVHHHPAPMVNALMEEEGIGWLG
jgi:hypothetical protein